MITLEFEVVSPEVQSIGGEDVVVAGTKFKHYVLTKNLNPDGSVDEAKSARTLERLNEFTSKCGVRSIEDLDNPTLDFLGKEIWALVQADAQPKRKTPTQEQVTRGQEGDIIKDPMTGLPVVDYYPKINRVFGPYSK